MEIGEIARGPDGVDRRLKLHDGQKVIPVWGLFDCHIDNAACDLKLLKRTIQVIKDDPDARVVMGGDFNDLMYAPGDYRFNHHYMGKWLHDKIASARDKGEQQVYLTDSLVEANLEILDPIRDRIDLYISGNHEEKFAKRHTTNLAAITAAALGVPFFPYESMLSYTITPPNKGGGSRRVDGLIYHGSSSGGEVTGAQIDLTRKLTWGRWDYIMRGHAHSNNEADAIQFERAGSFGNARYRACPIATLNIPSFEKARESGHVSFPKERSMRPQPLGASVMYLNIEYDKDGLLIIPSIKSGVPRA